MDSDSQTPKITRILVDLQPIGLRNRELAFENVRKRHPGSEEALKRALIEEMRNMKNYIPEKAEKKYGRALLQEYRRHLGEPVEDDEPEGLFVKVLGQGCPRCHLLAQEVMMALDELHLGADLDHVTDINQIAEYGVVGTPALVVNKEVKSVGRIPTREQIKEWLREKAQKGLE
jgi:small redox-active disulfide protein 2